MDFVFKKVNGVKIFDFKSTSYEKVLELLTETFDGCVVTTVSDEPGNYYIEPYKSNEKYVLSVVEKTNC